MNAYIVTCSACGTNNRIPAEKAGGKGRCGKCRAELTPLYYQPLNLTEGSFNDFIAKYPGPVLAEFWAPW